MVIYYLTLQLINLDFPGHFCYLQFSIVVRKGLEQIQALVLCFVYHLITDRIFLSVVVSYNFETSVGNVY